MRTPYRPRSPSVLPPPHPLLPSRRKPCSPTATTQAYAQYHTRIQTPRTVSGHFAGFLSFTFSPPRGLINIFNFTHVPFRIYMAPPPSFPPIPPPALFQSFSQTLLFPDHGRRCCRPSPLPSYLHRKARHPGRQPTHLNLSLDPPATDVLHTSPASGTSTFLSLSSLHSHQPLPLGSLLRP
jgi:hypothetical protein